jgi:hypothetical protein
MLGARGLVLLFAILASSSPGAVADDGRSPEYFPLHVGNWWAYEEVGDDGTALSRETWTVVAAADGEFHLRSSTKRLDVLGRSGGHRWEGHEFLRATSAGVHKRYPAGGSDAGVEVTVLKEPVESGTRWHDAQGECEASARSRCDGPRGELADCAVTVCRLGNPTATIVTSTYARGVGMVRQEVEVVQFLPALEGVSLSCDTAKGSRSALRLTAFHVVPQ